MTLKIQATYEGGILRLSQPLALAEGEIVEITLATTNKLESPSNEDEAIKRIKAARNIHEWLEATKLLPSDDDGYDIVKALRENRVWSNQA